MSHQTYPVSEKASLSALKVAHSEYDRFHETSVSNTLCLWTQISTIKKEYCTLIRIRIRSYFQPWRSSTPKASAFSTHFSFFLTVFIVCPYVLVGRWLVAVPRVILRHITEGATSMSIFQESNTRKGVEEFPSSGSVSMLPNISMAWSAFIHSHYSANSKRWEMSAITVTPGVNATIGVVDTEGPVFTLHYQILFRVLGTCLVAYVAWLYLLRIGALWNSQLEPPMLPYWIPGKSMPPY